MLLENALFGLQTELVFYLQCTLHVIIVSLIMYRDKTDNTGRAKLKEGIKV